MTSCVIGIDVVPVDRVERSLRTFGDAFIRRFFTQREIMAMPRGSSLHMAGRIAAKEACMKALGTGWPRISWTSLEILRDPSGRPRVEATGRALCLLQEMGIDELAVSISHDAGLAVAVVVGLRGGLDDASSHPG